MDVSGGCDCRTSLADALRGSAFPDGGRTDPAAGDGEPEEVAFCFWCGQPNVDPELAEPARFRRRSAGLT